MRLATCVATDTWGALAFARPPRHRWPGLHQRGRTEFAGLLCYACRTVSPGGRSWGGAAHSRVPHERGPREVRARALLVKCLGAKSARGDDNALNPR